MHKGVEAIYFIAMFIGNMFLSHYYPTTLFEFLDIVRNSVTEADTFSGRVIDSIDL